MLSGPVNARVTLSFTVYLAYVEKAEPPTVPPSKNWRVDLTCTGCHVPEPSPGSRRLCTATQLPVNGTLPFFMPSLRQAETATIVTTDKMQVIRFMTLFLTLRISLLK